MAEEIDGQSDMVEALFTHRVVIFALEYPVIVADFYIVILKIGKVDSALQRIFRRVVRYVFGLGYGNCSAARRF